MKFLERLIDRLIARAMRTPYTHIRHADGRPYMDRFWLARFGRGRGAGESGSYPLLAARVHFIRSSDDEAHFHDHPWPFVSIILRGGYFEVRPSERGKYADQGKGDKTWHGRGSIIFRRSRDWHRIKLPTTRAMTTRGVVVTEQPAVTLFLSGPYRQDWGFLTPIGKVAWRDFFSFRNRPTTVTTELQP